MEFRILGPVEARDGERILVGGSGKPVALLALLLLHRNELVSSDRLLDELWGGRAPRTALKTLQTYVSQLRRALGDGAIVTRPPGYLLAVARRRAGRRSFAALVASGRGALERGDRCRARPRALRKALALWRGPPLADLGYEPWAAGDSRAARGGAAAGARDTDRRGSRARAVSARSSANWKASSESTRSREHLLSLLMVALYRCGRQTEALEAYRAGADSPARRSRAIEPTPELRAVEQQILRHDPALGGPPARQDRPPAAGVGGSAYSRPLVARCAWPAPCSSLSNVAPQAPRRRRPRTRSRSSHAADASLEEITVGASPAHAIRAAGFLWTSNERDGTVSRVDITQRTVETIPVGRDPEGLAFADGDVWVANARRRDDRGDRPAGRQSGAHRPRRKRPARLWRHAGRRSGLRTASTARCRRSTRAPVA